METFKKIYKAIFEEKLVEEMLSFGVFKSLKKGEHHVCKNSYMIGVPLMISGALKILREDHDGHLVLYFIRPGETCSLTLINQTKRVKSDVCSVAQLDTELLILPKEKSEEWMGKYPSWQSFVLNTYQKRVHTLLELVDSFAFYKKEDRILRYIKEKADVMKTAKLKYNHQQVADDLYSSRVVISRILKKLEEQGRVKLGRGIIEIL
ncbi:Crp/Fnr family transcriptional regulator [Dokdonia sinensis]|uniref:Crp/Fnr family transcriptional regulator n=1 Tax=Dokdonia sinensis TaxID=2479847 RepID=A0A3M0GN15_9FLAO|nr:Crp/Fnr family transcriptional regulator [Dokdonia sinensis]RMB64122.1 Crp/Fnr family transcriptional regulator [Dokdonia sinensis]